MRAKELMEQVRKAEAELKLIGARKRHYDDLAKSLGSGIGSTAFSKQPSGSSRVESAAVALTDLATELDVRAKRYADLVRKAEKLIDKIPQENFRKVLTLRYLSGWSWRSIQDEMGYKDEKSTYRCNGYALRELQRLM